MALLSGVAIRFACTLSRPQITRDVKGALEGAHAVSKGLHRVLDVRSNLVGERLCPSKDLQVRARGAVRGANGGVPFGRGKRTGVRPYGFFQVVMVLDKGRGLTQDGFELEAGLVAACHGGHDVRAERPPRVIGHHFAGRLVAVGDIRDAIDRAGVAHGVEGGEKVLGPAFHMHSQGRAFPEVIASLDEIHGVGLAELFKAVDPAVAVQGPGKGARQRVGGLSYDIRGALNTMAAQSTLRREQNLVDRALVEGGIVEDIGEVPGDGVVINHRIVAGRSR